MRLLRAVERRVRFRIVHYAWIPNVWRKVRVVLSGDPPINEAEWAGLNF